VDALGMVEVNSIAVGIEISDAMMKRAEVKLLLAQPICCGKYMVIIQGGVAEVQNSVDSGLNIAKEYLVDSFVIANVHSQVFTAISGASAVDGVNAVGVIETFSLASCILAADAAVKAADVDLMEIRLGRGMGGKSFVSMTGDVSAVNHAVESGISLEECNGMIANTTIIPSPHIDVMKSLY
jgi:microcompartment protein CcmL/EutN